MLTAELYRDSLLLSHLARSIASDACNVHESCNTAWDALATYGDEATRKLLDSTYQDLAVAVGRRDLAEKQLSVLSPWDASLEAWNMTGTIKTQDGTHVIATPAGTDPLVEQYLATQRGRMKAWKFIAVFTATSAAAIVVGFMLGKGSKRASRRAR